MATTLLRTWIPNAAMTLAPTEELRAELESLRGQARERPEEYDERDPQNASRVKRAYRIKWAVKLGERRDAAAQPRPEKCWCNGIGGTGEEWLPLSKTFLIETSCHGCPEGDLARVDWAAGKKAESALLGAKRAKEFQQELPYRYWDQSLASYPITAPAQNAMVQRIREWLELWDGEPDFEWLFLHGPYGTGKSGLAAAVAYELLQAGRFHKAYFVEVPALLDRIRYTFKKGSDESEEDVMGELRSEDLLVLDDLGAERQTDWATERLFTVLNHRYEEKYATIITSNLTPSELGAHLGERTMWRIAEMADVVSLAECPNLRLAKIQAKKLDVTSSAEAA